MSSRRAEVFQVLAGDLPDLLLHGQFPDLGQKLLLLGEMLRFHVPGLGSVRGSLLRSR